MNIHLKAVDADHVPLSASGVPDFEGQPVDFTRLRLTSVSQLEVDDQYARMDDTVRLFVEGRVVRVDHAVDDKTGKLARIHTIKVIDAIQLPWDWDAGQLDT